MESHRFCRWLRHRIEAGEPVPPEVWPLLERDSAAVRDAIEISCTEGAPLD
jgi:hypothetical protein